MKIRKSTPIKRQFLYWTTAFATALISQPSLAHWQYTRWGMTLDEIVAASNGALSPSGTGMFNDGARQYHVQFAFAEHALTDVQLTPVNMDDCDQTRILADLRSNYGFERDGGSRNITPNDYSRALHRFLWIDRTNANVIVFEALYVEGRNISCFVQYVDLSVAQTRAAQSKRKL